MSATPRESDAVIVTDAPPGSHSNIRWAVCGLLFLATTINYMDRSVFSLIEPILKTLPFMGYNAANPAAYNHNFSTILAYFQVAYAVGFLTAGRIIDRVGTKVGYALAIFVWACASLSHALVGSVVGFCIARFMLGIGESGNFPAAIKAVTEWFAPQERAYATGLFNSGANVAALIAPLLIPWVTYRYGWHAAFLCTGSMGMLWLIVWLIFPYNKLRKTSSGPGTAKDRKDLPPVTDGSDSLSRLLANRGTWAFALGKMMTDPIWWFYLFFLPKYFNERFGLDMKQIGIPLVLIYLGSSVGSVAGGWLSGFRMRQGHSINDGRKFAMLVCALGALPVIFVPKAPNEWVAVALLALATAAHQGWSANLFSTPTDMFPSTSVSTIIGIGGTMGAVGGAIFTLIVGWLWISHPILIFAMAATAYVAALAVIQWLVPRLGELRTT